MVRSVVSLIGIAFFGASAEMEFAPGRTIVRFKPELRSTVRSVVYQAGLIGDPAFDAVARTFGFTRVERLLTTPKLPADVEPYGLDLIYLAYFPETIPVEEVNRALAALSSVESAMPDWRLYPCATPNDSLYPQEAFLGQIHAPDAWNITTGDTTVIIADPDIGVWWYHPDILPNLWINAEEDINHNGRFDTTDVSVGGDLNGIDEDGYGYVDDVIGWNFGNNTNNPYRAQGSGHGTATWGIASAATDNHIGIASLAWRCRGMALCIADAQGYMYTTYSQRALYYALYFGACVTNMSWGAYGNLGMESILNYCHDHGMQLCGGAGNDSKETPFYPAAYKKVIGVAGAGTDNKRAGYSNFGTWIQVCAPGVNVWATSEGGGYGPTSATSFCTPVATGLCALVKAANPRLTAAQRDSVIFATCAPMPDTLFGQGKLGYGLIDAGPAALAAKNALAEDFTPEISQYRITVKPNPGRGPFTFDCPSSPSVANFRIYDASGAVVRTLTRDPNAQPSGENGISIRWDGCDERRGSVPAGVYFIGPAGDSPATIAKMVIVR